MKEMDYKAIVDDLTADEFVAAVKETQHFFSLLKAPSLPDIRDTPALSPLAVLILLAHSDEQIKDAATRIYNKMQAAIASKQRPRGRKPERAKVQEYWLKWQHNPRLYATQAAFIRDMQEKYEIDRPETIRKWIKEFQK